MGSNDMDFEEEFENGELGYFDEEDEFDNDMYGDEFDENDTLGFTDEEDDMNAYQMRRRGRGRYQHRPHGPGLDHQRPRHGQM